MTEEVKDIVKSGTRAGSCSKVVTLVLLFAVGPLFFVLFEMPRPLHILNVPLPMNLDPLTPGATKATSNYAQGNTFKLLYHVFNQIINYNKNGYKG